ncbi:hypothetical protein [Pseudonocardia acidicola]|uniref:Uncharacterized protein n=1 Tax=Pseudonocardia acidicola TaxID=2724939 RepID=A0ABX1S9S9_9PSEU|nr:hypothetical protein [Pseudonocardia acidicola]NMH97317.1 hypothetical protein [Pseudonocardia acidicola]
MVRGLLVKAPAYVAFDLLGHDGVDLRDESYQQWRDALERLLQQWLPPGLVLTPMPRFRT